MLRGIRPEAVVAALQARRRSASIGPGRKLGLVVEGGAMRGVVSAGALLALEELGLTGGFDEVYGCSAGAVNAAYFLARQAAYGTTIYYQDLNDRRFINPWRVRRIADLDYVFDTVVAHVKPLRVDAALAAPGPLFISIVDAETAEGLMVHAQKSRVPLLTLLKASSALPGLYDRRIPVEDRMCCDGGLVDPIPSEGAIDNGCTDLLVLLTRPVSYREPPPGLPARLLLRTARGGVDPRLAQAARAVHRRANRCRELALGLGPPSSPVNILTVCPDDHDVLVQRTTTDAGVLKAAATDAALRMFGALGETDRVIVETLRSFPK